MSVTDFRDDGGTPLWRARQAARDAQDKERAQRAAAEKAAHRKVARRGYIHVACQVVVFPWAVGIVFMFASIIAPAETSAFPQLFLFNLLYSPVAVIAFVVAFYNMSNVCCSDVCRSGQRLLRLR